MRLRALALRLLLASAFVGIASQALAVSERTFKKTVFDGKKEQTAELGGEIDYEYTLELKPTQTLPECQAEVSISYIPMYDKVRVETTVEHDGCPASSGDYMVRVRTRGADGETTTEDIPESWQRTAAGSVETTKVYPLDTERELVWVRVQTARKTNCRCDSDPAAAETDSP